MLFGGWWNMDNDRGYSASRKQIRRMAIIVATLKKGDCTMPEIQDEMDRATRRDGSKLNCSERTVRGDMAILRNEFGCPVEYDQSLHRYVLREKSWEFTVPAILNSSELLAVVIGGKFSRDILPPSVSQRVEAAVNEVLRFNNTDGMIAGGRLDSLRIISNTGDVLSDEVFGNVFDAWRNCHVLLIEYNDAQDRHVTRRIEPHALVFYDMQWSIRACSQEEPDSVRTYLVSRIDRAYVLNDKFVPSDKIIRTACADNYYMFHDDGHVKIRLNRRGAQYARAHKLRSTQTLTRTGEDEYYLMVPSISIQEMLRWTLANVPGDVVPVEPPAMVNAYRKALEKMLEMCPEAQEDNLTD